MRYKMPNFSIEQHFDGYACGIDEVGRGPLAGPVLAACVYIPRELYSLPLWAQVNDSKKLSAPKRELIAAQIQQLVPFGIGQASVEEIDTYNILQATFIAMTRAYQQMIGLPGDQMLGCFDEQEEHEIPAKAGIRQSRPDPRPRGGYKGLTALIDGNRTPKIFPIPTQSVIKGDQISVSIAAASIIAKVARDAVMAELARDYPAYGWDGNAGYGTRAHLAALAAHGPCPHHRSSFAPVRQMRCLVTPTKVGV